MIETQNQNQQFPMDQAQTGFFSYDEALSVGLQGQDAALKAKGLATGCGQYDDDTANEDNNPSNCGKLNFAKAHFQLGGATGTGLKSMSGKDGTYSFVDTRNNNFSNRSQKLKIAVGVSPTTKGGLGARLAAAFGGDEDAATATIVIFIIVAVVVVVALLAAVGVVGVLLYMKLAKGSDEEQDEDGNVEMGSAKPSKPASRAGPPSKPGRASAPPSKPVRNAGPAKPERVTARA
jgi:hypothetical protein